MALFLTRADFERSCRQAGLLDLAIDPETGKYSNPHTAATYRVWESVAQSERVRTIPPAWLARRNGRDQAVTLTRPHARCTPEQWQRLEAIGWELPLALYPAVPCTSKSAEAILQERQRQQSVKGYSAERDQRYVCGELLTAGICYALQAAGTPADEISEHWPWPGAPMKPEAPLRALEKAGALVIAEHERRMLAQSTE